MGTYFLAIGIVLIVMLGWVAVQQVARLFAARHPEFGPYTEKTGCCGGRNCGGKSCGTSASDEHEGEFERIDERVNRHGDPID